MDPEALVNRGLTILLVAAVLATIVFFAIWEPLTRSRRDDAARRNVVVRVEPEKVQRFRIHNGDAVVEFRREGSGWRVGPDPKDRADSALVGQILDAAAAVTAFDFVDGSEVPRKEDLRAFELHSDKRRIEFDQGADAGLVFGTSAVSEDRVYARRTDGRDVFVIDDTLFRLAFRNAEDFRDRTVMALDTDQIDRVILRRSGGVMEIVRTPRGWEFTQPLRARADDAKVEAYLADVLSLQILAFLGDDTGDIARYGLVEGDREIAILAEGKERPRVIRFGPERDGGVTAGITSRDIVVTFPASAAKLLDITPQSLRDATLLALSPDFVDRIEITSGAGVVRLDRADDGWALAQPGGPRPASGAAVQALTDTLFTAKATSFAPVTGQALDAVGLATPSVVVRFLSVLSENTPEAPAGEQTLATVKFGTARDGSVAVQVDQSPEIATLPEAILRVIPTDPSAWIAP